MKVLMFSKALMTAAYHGKLRGLARLGIDLTAVVPERWGKQRVEPIRAEGYRLLPVRCALNGSHHLHFYPGADRLIRREDWDLIHIDEEPFNWVTYRLLRSCVQAHKKAIFFTWQNIGKTYPPPFGWFERFAFQQVEGAIAGSTEVRDVLLRRGFARPVDVIPQFGVNPHIFCKQNADELKEELRIVGKFAIGYVGRIVEEKGIADLIRAVALLPEECVLVLVGSGGFEFKARSLAAELNVDARLRWVQQLSSFEVPQYMNALDVLVLPSRTTAHWKEQFGRVLIEAMACEAPVVGSNSGEIPNVIRDTGLVFEEGNVNQLATGIQQIHDHPDLARQMGARARARVLDRFTHEHIASRTAEFYERVLSAKPIGACALASR